MCVCVFVYLLNLSPQVSMSVVACSEPSEGEPSVAAQGTREHLSSIVKQVSQSRLITLRKKKSGLSMSLSVHDNGERDSHLSQ